MMRKILTDIKAELNKNVNLEYKESCQRFFKEKVKCLGVPTPIIRRISAKYFRQVKSLGKDDIFIHCEELLKLNYKTIAFDWAFRLKKQYDKNDFKVFESWLEKYVSNWADCDDFCTHAFGHFMLLSPEFLPKINVWAKSKNRWLRRASAVILIYSVRRKKYLEEVFKIAGTLLKDSDDLVQKGYGWMLKEASNKYQKEVFQFVMKHKDDMPRTALRYAIEKMPPELKKRAMKQ